MTNTELWHVAAGAWLDAWINPPRYSRPRGKIAHNAIVCLVELGDPKAIALQNQWLSSIFHSMVTEGDC